MAYCAACGTEVQGRFCSKCGATVAQPAPGPAAGGGYQAPYQAPGPTAYQGQPQAVPMGAQGAQGLEENVACALCYALGLLTGIVFLVLAPYNQNKLIRFHAFQSIFFQVAFILVYIVAAIIALFLALIPFVRILIGAMYLLIWLAAIGSWLFLMYKAYNREKFVIPIIGPIAEKQA